MEVIKVNYSSSTKVLFGCSFEQLKAIAPTENSFIITDENLMLHYADAFKPWGTIVLPPGESTKHLDSIDDIVRQLIALEAGRDATIIGIGGGVITDIAGFVAGIYKRGVRCVPVPTSLLAMADAAIGGKNGIDIGTYKNMIGLVRQPDVLFYDFSFLNTLPEQEWINGFAEIIKHACIKDTKMFEELKGSTLNTFRKNKDLIATLIRRNFDIKNDIVLRDEHENGERRLLNFGHTFGHAIENTHRLPHGHAVAIGMVAACRISEQLCGFTQTPEVMHLIGQYSLPTQISFDWQQVSQVMLSDKKRFSNMINYVLLESIGNAVVKEIPVRDLESLLSAV